MDKPESFRRCIRTKKDVVKNIYMIHMLCQVAPNIGQGMIRDISKIFDEDNEKSEVSDRRLICDIECNNPKQEGVPVKWLKTLMCMDELSNAKFSILTEGLKITKELTHFDLELPENKNELIFRLPILPKLQAFKVDIENCTLLLHEEQEWNKGNCSELRTLVIKSVNIDVKTTGYIIEAISTCKDLLKLEFCPKDNSNADILAQGSKKIFYGWGRLAEGIKNMTKLSTVRLHNLQIREHLSALPTNLCRCPKMEILDLMNLKEIGTGKILKINVNDRELYDCKHYDSKQLENSNGFLKMFRDKSSKTLQIIKNAIIHAGNVPVAFSVLRHMHKLEKLTLCRITMPDSSWKELSEILVRLTKLKELSLAHLEIKNCFIEVQNLSKVTLLEMREVHLKETLWSKLGDEVMTLPKLKTLDLVSCKMSKNGYFFFLEKMNHSVFHVEMAKESKVEDSEMLSIDMVVASKKRATSKDVKTTSNISKD